MASEFSSFVTEHQEDFLDQWRAAVKIESTSTQPEKMTDMAKFLESVLLSQGFGVEFLPSAGYPLILGQVRSLREGAPTILIYGHYDVQPAEPLDRWESPPFEPTIRDGRLYGRGTGDNKGQHLAHIFGVGAVIARYKTCPVNIKVLLEGDEESGSPHLAQAFTQYRDKLSCDLAITSDGPMGMGDHPVIRLGVRGILSFELKATGAMFDNHSGHKGNVVPNPAWDLVHALGRLMSSEGRVLVPGFYDDVEPIGLSEEHLIQKLPFDPETLSLTLGLSSEEIQMWDPVSYYKRLMMPSFSINGIESGYNGPGSKSIIPASASVRCDFRLVAHQDPVVIEDRLRKYLAEVAPTVEYVGHPGFMYPSRTSPDHPAIPLVKTAMERAYGKEPYIEPAMGGSLPDYVFTRILNVPSFIIPYANQDEANHGPNENMRLSLFHQAIVATSELVMAFGQYS